MTDLYLKKPVVVEARQLGDPLDAHDIAAWCHGMYCEPWPLISANYEYIIEILTLEGTMSAQRGDWIIRGVHGEFYPCKPDIFEATYEKVT